VDREYDFSQGKRGAIESTCEGKTRITIRLDDDILAWLREHIKQRQEPLEEIL
jgi:uncharacterized protein (DUF4415 family)